jgi:hypothetical protein
LIATGSRKIGPAWTKVWNSPFLAAEVDVGGEVAQEVFVEGAAGEDGIEDVGVRADQDGAEAEMDELVGKLRGVASPDGEDRFQAERRHLLLPVGADVLQVEIPEGDVANPLFLDRAKGRREAFLVDLVRAVLGDEDLVERQSDRFRLALQQLAADAVDANAVVVLGDRG